MIRTTVTLEDDLDARLREIARERNISFKEALNTAIRRGLEDEPEEYVEEVVNLGVRPGVNIAKALQVAVQSEDHAIVHKLKEGE